MHQYELFILNVTEKLIKWIARYQFIGDIMLLLEYIMMCQSHGSLGWMQIN